MHNRRNYYRILRVQPDAPAEVIAACYRTLMQRLRMHPDLGGDTWNAAVINEAFAVLKDPEKRAAYDSTLADLADRRGSAVRVASRFDPAAGAEESVSMRCAFCHTLHSVNAARRPTALCAECRSPLFTVVRTPEAPDDAASRAVERIRRSISVDVYVLWPQKAPIAATSEDISIHGMRLALDTELAMGECVKIACEFCDAVGVVTHVNQHARLFANDWHAGLKFLTFRVRQLRGGLVSVDG